VNAQSRPIADMAGRLSAYDWAGIAKDLDTRGYAMLEALLSPTECRALTGLYTDDKRFRSRVVMARHGFGRGEYRYFAYPLPEQVDDLRTAAYPLLAPIANRWNTSMGIDVRYPATHAEFIERCHAARQQRPTPLLLRYGADDYNCLHQDLYGEHVFPLQLAILLSEPGRDFDGGEFVLTEQRPHAVAGRGGAAAPRRRGGIRRAPTTGARHARQLSGESSPRRQPCAPRPSPHARHHLPRRCLIALA
jgi:hypothetical protein